MHFFVKYNNSDIWEHQKAVFVKKEIKEKNAIILDQSYNNYLCM